MSRSARRGRWSLDPAEPPECGRSSGRYCSAGLAPTPPTPAPPASPPTIAAPHPTQKAPTRLQKFPRPLDRGISIENFLKVPHNAVLPQFLTWINPGGTLGLGLKFLSTSLLPRQAQSTATETSRLPFSRSIDHKTLLAVTNAAVELSLIVAIFCPLLARRKPETLTWG
jgi:hypothetical protein